MERPIQVTLRNVPQSDALLTYVQKRFNGALDRFDGEVNRISVRLSDENGPKGGLRDKRCRVEVTFVHHAQPVVVEEDDADMYNAIGRAAKTVKAILARQFGKRKHKHGAGLRGKGVHGSLKPT